jgi:hypothetical protein
MDPATLGRRDRSRPWTPPLVRQIARRPAAWEPLNGEPPEKLAELEQAGWIVRRDFPWGSYLTLGTLGAARAGLHLIEVRGRRARRRAFDLIAGTPRAEAWILGHLIRADPTFAAAAQGERTLRGHLQARLRSLHRSASAEKRRRARRLLAAWQAARAELKELICERWAPQADPGPAPRQPREHPCTVAPGPGMELRAADWRLQEAIEGEVVALSQDEAEEVLDFWTRDEEGRRPRGDGLAGNGLAGGLGRVQKDRQD